MKGEGEMFLVPIYEDVKVQEIVKRPAKLYFIGEDGRIEVELIEKPLIVCDICNSQVAIRLEELGRLPTGYVLCNDESILEVVCEDCRMRYYAELRVYDSLDEALEMR